MSSRRGRISNTKEDIETFKNIGMKIESIKKEKKITNKELSKKMMITPQAVSSFFLRLRTGNGVEIPTLLRIAKALDVKIKDFF